MPPESEDRGLAACHRVREMTDTIVLKFSGGKDSTAMWLRCRDIFPHIIPIFHYWCPDLEFVEETLRMYEKFFGQPIIRAPHPNFLNFQALGAYQPPHRMNVIDAYHFDFMRGYDQMVGYICDDLALRDTWTAVGLKASDSPLRKIAIDTHGAWTPKQRLFYPVADMRIAAVRALLEQHGCPLSDDYQVFGRSFDGFQYRYMKAVKQNYPEDYERIREWFPLVEAEFMRANAYAEEKKAQRNTR